MDELEIRRGLEQETSSVVAVLSGARRVGHWEPSDRVQVITLMGGADLDFREAVMLEGVTELRILALMGGVNVVVPRDLSVEVHGLGIMGGFSSLSHRAEDPEAPLLRVGGLAIMGGVNVKLR